MALEYISILIPYYWIVLSVFVQCIFVVSVVSCMCMCVCVCVLSDIDTDLIHFKLSIDKYRICGRYVYMYVCVYLCLILRTKTMYAK